MFFIICIFSFPNKLFLDKIFQITFVFFKTINLRINN